MSFRRNGFLHRLLIIVIAIGAFEGAAYAQFSVTIPGPASASTPAPTGQFTVTAEVSGNISSISKVVFYRNDVPYKTFLGSGSSYYVLTQDNLGQDTYTYRARAYGPGGEVDSNNFTLSVRTPRVFRMGEPIPAPSPSPGASPSPDYQTYGPGRDHDHTEEIQAAVDYLAQQDGGGTLFFPCTIPSDDSMAVYNIKATINIPSNVTLQGEGAEDYGKCRIYWNDVSFVPSKPDCQADETPLRGVPMFRVSGSPSGTSGVRFKDLSLYSRTTGRNCFNRTDFDQISTENTVAIEMSTFGSACNTTTTCNITDVIVENVSIRHFTHGIRAISDPDTESEISDIKIRAYRAVENHRQLYIDAKYAYNWDIQNLNINYMQMMVLPDETQIVQGGVEIVNAGRPASPTGENTKLKFLQLNCNGALRDAPDSFCVQVQKHGGLYFRQLHHEGVNNALIVQDISESTSATNPDPIVIESGVATGKFYDASMKLYTIGSVIFAAPEVAQPGQDSGRMLFIGDEGVISNLVDFGDLHWDITPTPSSSPSPTPSPSPSPSWDELGMYYSHTERNRGSFFATDTAGNKFTKAHTYGPPDINQVGGEYFDSGIMPTEALWQSDTHKLYSYVLNDDTVPYLCPSAIYDIPGCLEYLMTNGGSVYIDDQFTVDHPINMPRGGQMAGAPDAELTLAASNVPLIRIVAPIDDRTSGIVIRNLKLSTSGQTGTTGIEIVNADHADIKKVGGSSDMHFSGLIIDGFTRGFDARPYAPLKGQPMIDGISLKDLSFENNATAVKVFSGNASNWNIMNLSMRSSYEDSVGLDLKYAGHQSVQGVTCQGSPPPLNSVSPAYSMTDCIKMSMTGSYLAGFKQTDYVINALTIQDSTLTYLVVRDSDFRSNSTTESRVNLRGRAFIVSLNNKYTNFDVQTPAALANDPLYRADFSRLTYCGDTYDNGVYSGLATRHPNIIVGAPTLTRVECGPRPMPWDDAIKLGGEEGDRPLVGNFFDDVREDFVIYRPGSPSQFLIKQAGGTDHSEIDWGTTGDIPMIGRFYPDTKSQIVVYRPSTGYWWVKDPYTSATYSWNWGVAEDKPFVGNFLDESGSASGNKDEAAVYRKSTKTFYILNPRTMTWVSHTTTADDDSEIQVGDFRGVGYDQIAQYKSGVWKILDPRNGNTYTANLGEGDDVPVAGKYLPGSCTQIAVWRRSTQPVPNSEPIQSEFIVKDPPFPNCAGRPAMSMVWGSNNVATNHKDDDIPLTINTADGPLRRPTVYRPTKGAYPFSISNGQWWVHDLFAP